MLIISCNCLGVWKKAHKKKDSGRNDRSLLFRNLYYLPKWII